jgi:predicted aspartyl protease
MASRPATARSAHRVGVVVLVALALGPTLFGCAGPGYCRKESVASVPVRVSGGGFLVPARINGIDSELLLDTGASNSLLNEAAISRLGLQEDSLPGVLVTGVGGATVSRRARVEQLELGGYTWDSLDLTIVRFAHHFADALPVAGILGARQMREFDVELDVPRGRMTLWRVTRCDGDLTGWAEQHYVVPLTRHRDDQMIAEVVLDGHPLAALIDWGATGTTVAGWFAASIGVTPDALAADRAVQMVGLDHNEMHASRHRFDTIQIGNEILRGRTLNVADVHLHTDAMVLGADFARTRRVWLSYATEQMFVMPPRASGGTVR